MHAEITIDRPDTSGRHYLTWAPRRATVGLVDPPGAGAAPVPVTLTSGEDSPSGGRLAFADTRDGTRAATLKADLPADGSAVEVWLTGAVPSVADQDASVVVAAADGSVLGSQPVMVRVRKNALTLTAEERDRFTTALAVLNDSGHGPFRAFREMHREQVALDQAHGAPGFLSWHRAYLLDLERELQLIDPSVTLPYWKFDEAAPDLFTEDFMGASPLSTTNDGGASVVFAPENLLREWRTDEGPGINRTRRFELNASAFVRPDAETLALGGPDAIFDNGRNSGPDPTTGQMVFEIGFDEMEGDPHGFAHTSFYGVLRNPGTAPRDPVFYLLHCNVDRLWALWQWTNDRFDPAQPGVYFFTSFATDTSGAPVTRAGHNLRDTMWPWNGVTADLDPSRPTDAPRNPFPHTSTSTAPPFPRVPADQRNPRSPTVADMIDYQGRVDPGVDMNFAYDTVPFGPGTDGTA